VVELFESLGARDSAEAAMRRLNALESARRAGDEAGGAAVDARELEALRVRLAAGTWLEPTPLGPRVAGPREFVARFYPRLAAFFPDDAEFLAIDLPPQDPAQRRVVATYRRAARDGRGQLLECFLPVEQGDLAPGIPTAAERPPGSDPSSWVKRVVLYRLSPGELELVARAARRRGRFLGRLAAAASALLSLGASP
jgi:hypothetical protein